MVSPNEETLDTFLVSENTKVAYDCIYNMLNTHQYGRNFVYLHGPTGSGKSHLLKAVTSFAQKNDIACIHINIQDWLDFDPSSFLDDVEKFPVICIDNIDVIAGNYDWETELFSLFNRWLEQDKGLFIVTSNKKHSDSGFVKNEFLTRLQSGITLSLKEPTQDVKEEILIFREELRGGVLPKNLAREIVNKLQTLPECLDALQKIDHLSLETKKGINKRIVATVLSEMLENLE